MNPDLPELPTTVDRHALLRAVFTLDDTLHRTQTTAREHPEHTLGLVDIAAITRTAATITDGIAALLARRIVNDGFATLDTTTVVHKTSGADASEDLHYGVLDTVATAADQAARFAQQMRAASREILTFVEVPNLDDNAPSTLNARGLRDTLDRAEALTHFANYQATAQPATLDLWDLARLTHFAGNILLTLSGLLDGQVQGSVDRFATTGTAARLYPGAGDTTAPFEVKLLPLFNQAGPFLATLAAELHVAAKELTQIGALLPDLAIK